MKRIYLLLGAVLVVMLSLIPINALAATVTPTFHQIDLSGVFNSDAYTGGQNYTDQSWIYYHVDPTILTTYSDPDYGNVPMDMKEAGQNNVWLSHGASRTSAFTQQITLTTDIHNAATIWLAGFDAGWGNNNSPVEVKYKLDGVDTTVTYIPNDWTTNGSGDENLVLWVDHRNIGSAYGDISVARIILPHAGYLTEITVTDPDTGYWGTSFPIFAITVAEAVIPAVDAGLDATINEGDTYTGTGLFVDPDSNNWTATVDYGDSFGVQSLTLNPDKTFALSHTYADNGIYTVTVTVTDDDGGNGTDTAMVTVNNIAPVVDAGSDATIDEGSTFNSSGSFTDPGADIWNATVDYGDGSVVQALTLSGKTFSLSHTYADNGIYTVTVTVTDDDGGNGTDTAMVTVNNVVPTVDAGINQTVYAGDTVDFNGTFSDPGWLDTHTAIWDFGNGDTGAGAVSEENNQPDSTGTVTGSYVFYEKGTYTVTLYVTDDDGGVGSDTLEVNVLPIPAQIDFEPETLNLKSEGKWITVFIEFPTSQDDQDWDVHEIDADSIMLNGVVPAIINPKYGFVKNSVAEDENGNNRLMLKFDRNLVQGTLEVGENIEICITGGLMYNGGVADFEGIDNIRVINSGNDVPAEGKAVGKEDAPGQNKEGDNNSAEGKAVGREDAPGQNKEGDNNAAEGKAIGKEDAPGQNK